MTVTKRETAYARSLIEERFEETFCVERDADYEATDRSMAALSASATASRSSSNRSA